MMDEIKELAAHHVEGEVGASGGITWGNITDQQ